MFFESLESRRMLSTTVSVADVTAAAPGTATFNITLDKARTDSLNLRFSEINGTAKAKRDYTSTAGSLTIPAGQTTGSVAVKLLDHGDVSGTLSFKLKLIVLGKKLLATAFVQKTFPIVTASSVAYTSHAPKAKAQTSYLLEPKTGTRSVAVTLKLSKASANKVGVSYTWINGTAINGTDFSATNGSVYFSPGQTSKKITFLLLPNLTSKPSDLTFSLHLTPVTPVGLVAGADQTFKIAAHDASGNALNPPPTSTSNNNTVTVP